MHSKLTRRRLLLGSLGGASVAVGIPVLDAMLNSNGTAFAQAEPLPTRLGIFFWGNGRGVDATRWNPAVSGAAWELSPQLLPLASVKDYLNVVSNLSVRIDSSRDHHRGSVGMLSGGEFIEQDPGNANYRSTFADPSIDQVAASVIGTSTLFRSVEVGISSRVAGVEGTTLSTLSHNGPDNVNPAERDPSALFNRLFSGGITGESPALDLIGAELRASVLDSVMLDLGDLKARVGTRDRVRLEQHSENIRAIESRLQAGASGIFSCEGVQDPGGFPANGSQEPLAERMLAMSELITVAVACDLTRVFSVLFSGSVGGTVFWQVGADRGHHDLSHDGAASQDLLDASTIFTMEQLAVLLNALRNTPEGAGNLLDHMAILATSDQSDGAVHSEDDMPIIVAGAANGYFRYPGIHYRGTGGNTSTVLLSLLRSVGLPLTEFGGGGGLVSESLTDIEV